MPIGKLEKVELRELWIHEERGFSAWLMANLEPLCDSLGFVLAEPQREVRVGTFEVDLVAEDENGNRVIIENQLETTDHDHLGKVLTYLTNLEAKIAVWITKFPRPEHIKAVAWLNETTPDDISFFLIRLDAYRIGTSDPAPLFTVIVGPSAEAKAFGQQKKELAERHVLRLKFWEGLLARAKERGLLLHASRSPTKEAWISGGAGRSGLTFNCVIFMEDEAAAEFYIDTGDRDDNKSIFDALAAKRDMIDQAFGGKLDWERLDEKRACRIRHTITQGGLTSGEEAWSNIQEAMIDAMRRLAGALKPFLSNISPADLKVQQPVITLASNIDRPR